MNYLKNERKKYTFARSLLDYFMGLVMVLFGLFMLFSAKVIGHDYFDTGVLANKSLRYLIAPLFMLYGVFRVWRGYKMSKMTIDED
jgi:uncharacterized membrane protein HdeD (DUF308 family)